MAKSGERDGSAQEVYRLLYCSRLDRSKTETDIDNYIAAIIEQSRAWNPSQGITGVLITNRVMFSQVLEGPARAVKTLIGHIICDSRHRDVNLISHHRVSGRMFQEWSMALIVTGSREEENLFFPGTDGKSDILAISTFCATVRRHLLGEMVAGRA